MDTEPVADFVDLIRGLNTTIGRYGIGRFSSLEHLENGEKVLEVREAPAATLILEGFAQPRQRPSRWKRSVGCALSVKL